MKRAYVYPNVAEFNQESRGGLQERWDYARSLEIKCEYIEMPAHLIKIKSKNDIKKTGLPSESFLTNAAIAELYGNTSYEAKYILHSEFRSGSYLQWNKPDWVKKMVEMLISISNHFNVPPMAVEIHPGGSMVRSKISYDHLIEGSRKILQGYEKLFSHQPLILLENRTKQFISTGEDLAHFWENASDVGKDIIEQLGIVLDIQQLFTSLSGDKELFLKHFGKIPDEAIKGVHIHSRRNNKDHQTPSLDDPIPWENVFSRLKNLPQFLIINPEVHHHKDVSKTIEFCEDMFEKFLSN